MKFLILPCRDFQGVWMDVVEILQKRKIEYNDIGDKKCKYPFRYQSQQWYQKKDNLHPARHIVPLGAIGDSPREIVARSAPL